MSHLNETIQTIAALIAAASGLLAAWRVGHVKELINSRMTELLKSETGKSRAEGVIEGKASREP